MRQYDHHIINYCDDLIGYGLPSKTDASFNTLCSLLQELGLTISEAILVPPSTSVTCLGILINTIDGRISEKLCWMTGKTPATKRQLQSLLGSLLHATKCVKNARFFLNRMLTTFRNAKNPHDIKLDQDLTRDPKWFQQFLPLFNGVCLYSQRQIQGVIQVDTSCQGLWGHWDNQVYKLAIPLGYSGLGIVQLEILNVFLALRVWGSIWGGHQIKLECGEAVVAVLMQDSRDPVLAVYAHNIHMIASYFDINLFVINVSGIDNTVADLLSR